MRNPGALAALIAILLLGWFLWSRLHIVIWIPVPWWGALIGVVLLFLVIQHLIVTLLKRRP
jgi:putative effector of murein hydrolase LrgA (UPF0299 family)